MAKVGSYGKRRKSVAPDTIEFFDVELTLRPIDGLTLIDFMEASSSAVQGNPDAPGNSGVLPAMMTMLRKCFDDDNYAKFRAECEDKAVELPEIMEFFALIVEWASARPTQSQSGPSGLPSTDGTSANDSFSKLAAELSGQATPEDQSPENTGQSA